MKIRIVGHNMKYEAECITMLFFPDEKIVTTEYPADTEFPEQDEEDFIEARQQRGLMKVTLHLNGRETSLCRTVLSNPRTPYEEAEYIMSDMMFTLYLEATGSGESHIRCVQRGGKLYLTAQDAALTVKIESYLETEPLDSMALSAGETCTIRIRDDGMEFVR